VTQRNANTNHSYIFPIRFVYTHIQLVFTLARKLIRQCNTFIKTFTSQQAQQRCIDQRWYINTFIKTFTSQQAQQNCIDQVDTTVTHQRWNRVEIWLYLKVVLTLYQHWNVVEMRLLRQHWIYLVVKPSRKKQ